MKNLDETSVAYFADTPSKKFLLSVIEVLARYHHISVAAINKKDEELGLLWNWLNVAARSLNANKIIEVLKKYNLFNEGTSEDVNEATDPRVLAARKAERDKNREMLLLVQSMSIDSIIEDIKKKVPGAEWQQFKNGATYKGKITYEADDGYAELWVRNDGLVVCSSSGDPRKVRCYSDDEIFRWIDAHPKVIQTQEDVALDGSMIDEIAARIEAVFDANPITKFRKQEKVVGNQRVFDKTGEPFDIWYRPSGEIFCKTPNDKFFKFNELHKFERFVKSVLKLKDK